ncbi:MAG TPA: transposase [Alcanivorax sp.]|jgi:predicted transposase YdaD|nr:transposase [Alcanivorax sp.]
MDDHDTSYRLLFSHAEMVRDLLTGFVPESWIAELDLNSLEKMNGSYVSDDLRSRHNDAIWRVRWGQEWIYIYLLLEFQSTVDRFMPVRILTYTGLLYQDLVRRQELDNSRKLPPVLPIVLYNGAARWRAPTRVSGLIQPGPAALAEFQPDQALLLIDEGAFDMDELAPLTNLVAALFRLEHRRSLAEVPEILKSLIDWLSDPELISLRHSFVEWLQRRLRHWLPDVTIPEMHDLQEGREMIRDIAQEWKDQHHQTGLLQGLEQGSTNEARAILRRQLVRRFGDVPAEIDARLERATRAELEGWIDRPYEVDTLEDVFRPS